MKRGADILLLVLRFSWPSWSTAVLIILPTLVTCIQLPPSLLFAGFHSEWLWSAPALFHNLIFFEKVHLLLVTVHHRPGFKHVVTTSSRCRDLRDQTWIDQGLIFGTIYMCKGMYGGRYTHGVSKLGPSNESGIRLADQEQFKTLEESERQTHSLYLTYSWFQF